MGALTTRINRQIGPFREMARVAWENRDRLPYAWRILDHGVCDGCALGTKGMRDWTIEGIHLCWVRLNLLRLNTAGALDPATLSDVGPLAERSERELRSLGRLPAPMLRRRGEPGFRAIGWEEALALAAARLRAIDPLRLAFYLVSRGTLNETYYAAQKAARYLGTNHVDNSARVCHAPSTVALKQTTGFAATTCSYRDLMATDLAVFFGSDVANNQPVMMKYLHLAKKRGTQVVVVNPFREPGLDRYWVPSSVDSALLGTRIADAFYTVAVGGDIAFINGVLKVMAAEGWIDRAFIAAHTTGWEELERVLAGQGFDELEQAAGTGRAAMHDFARRYAEVRSALLVWSMGLTMHTFGVENVQAVVNLGLARAMVGRPGCGLMPIRGHSGVQGGAEMGCVPNALPGGTPLDAASAARFSELWGFEVPDRRGDFVAEMVDRAHAGGLDALWCVGSNLMGILPDRDYVREALARIPLRVHHDIVFNPQMLVEPADTVLLLPATTRYEVVGGGTETSTERRVIFSPEVPGPRVPQARDEWRVLLELAARVRPRQADRIRCDSTDALRAEIARAVPAYAGIERLHREGDQFQWGGPMLGEGGHFATPDGRARFTALVPPEREASPGQLRLTTRRGKQFNSMVFGRVDTPLGRGRDEVMLAAEDLHRLGLAPGDRVTVRSATGSIAARVVAGELAPGTLMMYWPEANVLIRRGIVDPQCGIPAYRDTLVEVTPAGPAA